ncbi:hypothetical protein, partial [Bacillus subtilis]|uniref:hypothetical protein n=1 Tax=Bacillus subtilis TaxID=1423 RepID=UPI00295EF21B
TENPTLMSMTNKQIVNLSFIYHFSFFWPLKLFDNTLRSERPLSSLKAPHRLQKQIRQCLHIFHSISKNQRQHQLNQSSLDLNTIPLAFLFSTNQ